jgi:hypothetical protein
MVNKVMTTILIIFSISSLFLPFQEYKSMWADFEPSGSLVNSDFIDDDSFTQNKTISGYELIIPIIPVVLITIGNIFLGFIRTKSSKTISITLIGLSVLFTLYLYLPIGSPVEATPNSLFRPPIPMIGIGYYILLVTSIVSFVYSLLRFKR